MHFRNDHSMHQECNKFNLTTTRYTSSSIHWRCLNWELTKALTTCLGVKPWVSEFHQASLGPRLQIGCGSGDLLETVQAHAACLTARWQATSLAHLCPSHRIFTTSTCNTMSSVSPTQDIVYVYISRASLETY